jgi:hypothetical protein
MKKLLIQYIHFTIANVIVQRGCTISHVLVQIILPYQLNQYKPHHNDMLQTLDGNYSVEEDIIPYLLSLQTATIPSTRQIQNNHITLFCHAFNA